MKIIEDEFFNNLINENKCFKLDEKIKMKFFIIFIVLMESMFQILKKLFYLIKQLIILLLIVKIYLLKKMFNYFL